MVKTRTCALCDTELERPHEEHANYVSGVTATEEVEVTYAMVHTEETKKRLNKMDRLLPHRNRQALAAEMARPGAPETMEVPAGTKDTGEDDRINVTADTREFPFSIPEDEFTHVEVDDPNVVQRDDDVAYTYTEYENREITKTGLLCSNCTDPETHGILWGVDNPS